MISLIQKVTGIHKDQVVPASLAAVYLFCIMAGYYILKPLREGMGLLIGKDLIPRLFIASMVVMLVANPIFSFLLSRFSRVRFIKFIYRFFALNILGFIAALKYLEATNQMVSSGKAEVVQGPAFIVAILFYLWVSVFNLFAMSVFWALMADLYSGTDSKKIFGFVGAGGTLGQLIGSGITGQLATVIGTTNLLFVTVVLLELGVQTMFRVTRDYEEPTKTEAEKKENVWAGIAAIGRSKYLMGICLYLFLYTFTSSFIYFQGATIVSDGIADHDLRVKFYADLNLIGGGLTVLIQTFLTGRILPLIGLGAGLSLVPVITFFGLAALAMNPSVLAFAIVDTTRRTVNYAFSRPSREILFTAVSRREKYLSKSFIDTFVYRGGDSIASVSFDGIKALGYTASATSYAALPVAVLYFFLSLALGKAHGVKMKQLEEAKESAPQPSP